LRNARDAIQSATWQADQRSLLWMVSEVQCEVEERLLLHRHDGEQLGRRGLAFRLERRDGVADISKDRRQAVRAMLRVLMLLGHYAVLDRMDRRPERRACPVRV